MKKLFNVFAILALVVSLASCNPKPVSILNQAKADYAEAIAETPDTLTALYEIQMVLDKPISVVHQDGAVRLLTSMTAIQQDSIVTLKNRAYDKKGKVIENEVEQVVGYWLGDMRMPLDSLVLDLADAIQKLQETDIVLPEGDKVTLRTPAAPPFRPLYIFGTHGTFFVAVDAISGEVTDFASTEDEFVGIKNEEVAE